MSTSALSKTGNDTIDPYPLLIPGEAAKILCVTANVFKIIQKDYQAFYRGLLGRPAKRSFNIEPAKADIPSPQRPLAIKELFSTYEPSAAIILNECEYRRWCRVSEWFNTFGQGIYE